MLPRAAVHTTPFPFLFCPGAFNDAELHALAQTFQSAAPWQHRDAGFYKCYLREITDELSAEWLGRLAARMRELLGLPLTNSVVVTAQRVEPGQAIGVHSDRPLLGYEIARLVVQLNPGWQPEHGGVLELFESEQGDPMVGIQPKDNIGFAFVLNHRSYHGVTRANQTRRSAVFNFWHLGNTPELKRYLDDYLANLSFGELPAELKGVQDLAEGKYSDELTHRAALAATLLMRAGYEPDVLEDAYRGVLSLTPAGPPERSPETRLASQFSSYLSELVSGPFDLLGWERLARTASAEPVPERLKPLWSQCFPDV